jgi:hypothetical protein
MDKNAPNFFGAFLSQIEAGFCCNQIQEPHIVDKNRENKKT